MCNNGIPACAFAASAREVVTLLYCVVAARELDLGVMQEAVDMAHFLLQNEGLWVGSSSAVNCVGAVKVARNLGRGNCVVTILCDGGHRHLSKFYDRKFLEAHDLQIPGTLDETLSWVGSAFTSDPVNQL